MSLSVMCYLSYDFTSDFKEQIVVTKQGGDCSLVLLFSSSMALRSGCPLDIPLLTAFLKKLKDELFWRAFGMTLGFGKIGFCII